MPTEVWYDEGMEDNKALRMFNLWRERRLPADVVVIEVPIERTGYGDFRAVDYGPSKVMVANEDRNPAPDYRNKVIDVLGWNEYPPRLIVGTEDPLADFRNRVLREMVDRTDKEMMGA